VGRPVNKRLKREAKTLRQALGTVVTRLRVERNWSQKKLAQKSGYEYESIGRMERGTTHPGFQLIVAMADVFKMRVSQLFTRAERLHRKQAAKPQTKS
jgi:transcriptional regulator with XRE-family HTH domain